MNITKRQRIVLGCAFFALMFVNVGSAAYSTIYRLTQTSVRGWEPAKENGKLIVSFVNPEGPATALQVGDEVIALKSERPDAIQIAYREGSSYWPAPPGTAYTLWSFFFSNLMTSGRSYSH